MVAAFGVGKVVGAVKTSQSAGSTNDVWLTVASANGDPLFAPVKLIAVIPP
jgi:hypothetical protein